MTTDIPGWKQRAETFLESHLGDNDYNAEEAAVYFLSRKINTQAVSDTINRAIKRWKNDNTRWSEECRRNPTRAASTLRLMQWGDIGALQKYRDSIYQNFGVPYGHDFYPSSDGKGGYLSKTAAFSPLLFPLFTSDCAINQMGPKLFSLLHLWQNHLNDLFMRKELFGHSIEEDERSSQTYATLISAYIFAAYRLNKSGINQTILDKSIQYLLDHQHDSGLWAYDDTAPDSEEDDCSEYSLGDFLNSRKHVILTAIGILALSLTDIPGAKRSIDKAASWLLQHQHSTGGWYQHGNIKYSHQVQTTVMVLDALELADCGKHVTFSLSNNNLKTSQTQEDEHLHVKPSSITINASDILLKLSGEQSKGISIADDIKKKIVDSKNELFKDNLVNQTLYIEFEKYESERAVNSKARRPTYRQLSKTLRENGITPIEHPAQTIKNWVQKLIDAGLIQDHYQELKRASRERATDSQILDDRKQDDVLE